ncbi:MAG: PAS domain-containing protein [Lentisphaerae bacterium]|nr:PAS domain-containing protein [Lentisphaerota bacterium]
MNLAGGKRSGRANGKGRANVDLPTESAPLGDLIQKAKTQLEQMIDLNPESMVLVNPAGDVLRANRAFVALLAADGYQGVLGRKLVELFPLEDLEFFSALLAGREGYDAREVSVRLGDGRERLLRFTVVGGRDAETLVVIAHDATLERTQAELVEKAYKVEAIRALMGALMHHLNQPLTVVMIRAKLMQQAVEAGKVNTDELKSTFRDIMDLSMKMANILKKVEDSEDYKTQEYMSGLDILKIDD